MSCVNCVPDVDYLCSIHRPENQCVGCMKTNQKLIVTGMGIICRDCAIRGGMIYV